MSAGPAAPTMTDQKRAGRSRAAQRQYRRGVDQKTGAADIVPILGQHSSIHGRLVGWRG